MICESIVLGKQFFTIKQGVAVLFLVIIFTVLQPRYRALNSSALQLQVVYALYSFVNLLISFVSMFTSIFFMNRKDYL